MPCINDQRNLWTILWTMLCKVWWNVLRKYLWIALTLTSLTLLNGCIRTETLDATHRPSDWAQSISPSANFYQVSPDVFRSEQPSSALVGLIREWHIGTVINLRSRNPDATVLANQGFSLKHIPINTWQLNREHLLRVMQEIQQAQLREQKVLLHCYHGSDRTGASVAMYRIIFQGWSREAALAEMKYGGYGFHPIWVNIEPVFSPENIDWIRQQLAQNHNSSASTTFAP